MDRLQQSLYYLFVTTKVHKQKESQQKEENEKTKKGNPEDLSIRLLREILDEMGEPYSKSWKKGVLIEKVRAAREKANNTTCTASV